MSAYPNPASFNILAVDDTPDNLVLVQLTLEREGYLVRLASDGQSALAEIQASPPDLLILDVMMPGMSGYDVTQRIRQAEANLPYIPILLITAHEQSSVVKGLDLGADDFIRKPVRIDELLARVRSLLRLKYAIDQRENFVSCLTHDLRTPLVAADRMLTLLQQGVYGQVSSEAHEALGNIIHSNENLLQMLNTLLEVHCYEVGEKMLSFITFDFKALVYEVVQELFPLAEQKSLTLRVVWQADTHEICGDRLELRRVLTNLVSNAIKFTETGSITVQVQRVDTELQLTTEDTGEGISPENQLLIFERFRRGTHKQSGHGLGLHLCRQIIQAHRGKISCTSTPRVGSVFSVCLPLDPSTVSELSCSS
ncbi:response regulator [Synechococcales cyanobacterium C]|uniref:histidine kinase n=1 Tax=Petrachloros mirabilis ULC683 TaxID=2781853 RepID=A0A8K2A149_9CYAN|nr:hybrid sensor histidine kinase/response regulator [Petrachloros mirabilis]NCJ07477.1 response regulator [Petrachloros mirabilis ULC683]